MMNKTIRITEDAKTEIVENTVYYENIQKGLGVDFKEEVKTTISKIKSNPYSFQKVTTNKDIRRALMQRFPFKIYYSIQSFIAIFAVRHTSRDVKDIEE